MKFKHPMTKIMRDLYNVCRNKEIDQWNDVKEYAEGYKKYDDLTFREIDSIVFNLTT